MSYKLSYQSLRARAEPIRMVFHYAGIPFEDEIIPLSQWAAVKNDKKLAPLSQLPSLTLPNGEVIAQTSAILRLAAKIGNIYPSDPFEAAKADMLFDLVNHDMNVIHPILNWWEMGSDSYNSNYNDFFSKLPATLDFLEEDLGDKQFFGGDRPHHGDFGVFNFLSNTVTVKPGALKGYPRLIAFVDRVAKLPAIAQYLKNRPRALDCGMPKSFIQENQAEFTNQFPTTK